VTPKSTADLVPIQRAILSVSDKTGLIDLARVLADRGVALLASGGTYKTLLDSGFEVTEISNYTGQPEILGGRVKTLHPKIHGGILARRELPEDMTVLAESGMEPIDLIVVNLYPFEQTVARPGVTCSGCSQEPFPCDSADITRPVCKIHRRICSPWWYKTFYPQRTDAGCPEANKSL
jgi:hypothetical protein